MPGGGLKESLQLRRQAVALGILLAGFVAGLVLYLTVPPPVEDVLGNQADQSKQYLRQMEEYGGAINQLATSFRDWFNGLWHGPTLGVTVFCLSALVAGAVYLALTPLPPRAP